jgi:hypothetical protein
MQELAGDSRKKELFGTPRDWSTSYTIKERENDN